MKSGVTKDEPSYKSATHIKADIDNFINLMRRVATEDLVPIRVVNMRTRESPKDIKSLPQIASMQEKVNPDLRYAYALALQVRVSIEYLSGCKLEYQRRFNLPRLKKDGTDIRKLAKYEIHNLENIFKGVWDR